MLLDWKRVSLAEGFGEVASGLHSLEMLLDWKLLVEILGEGSISSPLAGDVIRLETLTKVALASRLAVVSTRWRCY